MAKRSKDTRLDFHRNDKKVRFRMKNLVAPTTSHPTYISKCTTTLQKVLRYGTFGSNMFTLQDLTPCPSNPNICKSPSQSSNILPQTEPGLGVIRINGALAIATDSSTPAFHILSPSHSSHDLVLEQEDVVFCCLDSKVTMDHLQALESALVENEEIGLVGVVSPHATSFKVRDLIQENANVFPTVYSFYNGGRFFVSRIAI